MTNPGSNVLTIIHFFIKLIDKNIQGLPFIFSYISKVFKIVNINTQGAEIKNGYSTVKSGDSVFMVCVYTRA